MCFKIQILGLTVYIIITSVNLSESEQGHHSTIEENHTTCSQANKTIAQNKTPGCYCDSMCPEYGDCCLESTFGIDASKPPQNCTKFANEAFFVKRDCSASKYKARCAASANYTIDKRQMRNLVPATSPTTGITYGNRLCALCHNATDVQLWNVNVTCTNNFSDTLVVANATGNKFAFSLTQNLTADKLTYSKKTKSWSLKLGNVTQNCSLRPAVPGNVRQTVRPCHPNLVDHCTINGSVPIVCNGYQEIFQANGTYYKNPTCAPCTGVPQKPIKPVAPSVGSAAAVPPRQKNSTASTNASRSTALATSSTRFTRPYFDVTPSGARFGVSRRASTVTTRMLTVSTGVTNASAGAAMQSTGPATGSVGATTRSARATNVSVGATTGFAKTITGSIAATTGSAEATTGFISATTEHPRTTASVSATTASYRVTSGSTDETRRGSTRAATEFVGATARSTRTRFIRYWMRTPRSTISRRTTSKATTADLPSSRKSINRDYLRVNFRDSEGSLDQLEMSKILAETVYYSTISRTFISSSATVWGKDLQTCDIANANSNSNSNSNSTTRITTSSQVARIVATVFNLVLVLASLFLGLSLRHLVSAECESAGSNREYRCIMSSYTIAALISNAGWFFTNILDECETRLFQPLDELVNYFTFFASMTCATTMAFHVARTSWKAFYRFSAVKNDAACKNLYLYLYSTLNWFLPAIVTTLQNCSRPTSTSTAKSSLHSSIFLIFPFIVFVFVNLSFYASAAVLIRVEQKVEEKLAKLSINFKLFSALLGTTYLMWMTVLLFSHLTSYLLMVFYYFLNLVVSLLIYRIVKGKILVFSTETVLFMGDDSTLVVRNKAE